MKNFQKVILSIATFLLFAVATQAQVKIGDNPTTINASSMLEVESTNKGLLFPRVALTSTTSFAPLASHVAGMTVYNTATAGNVIPGLYVNNGTAWTKMPVATSSSTAGGGSATVYSTGLGNGATEKILSTPELEFRLDVSRFSTPQVRTKVAGATKVLSAYGYEMYFLNGISSNNFDTHYTLRETTITNAWADFMTKIEFVETNVVHLYDNSGKSYRYTVTMFTLPGQLSTQVAQIVEVF